MLDWYAMRWKIETFHKILKSGCKVESSKLRAADRLVNIVSIFCILSWRIFWMTMVSRTNPNTPALMVFNDTEIMLLYRLKKIRQTSSKQAVSICINGLAKLGGYLGRASDPPPGNQIMWKDLPTLN